MPNDSILFLLKESVQEYAQVISDVLGVDVDIADLNLIRIGGTGRFSQNLNKPFVTEGNAFNWVISNKKTLFIENARENEICKGCQNIAVCRDQCELCCPINYNGNVVGVISIGSINDEQKEMLCKNLEKYVAFLEKVADFISAKASEHVLYREQKFMLDLLEKLMELIQEGVIVFDERRQVRYINKKTELVLGHNLAQLKYLHKINQFSIHNVLSPSKSGAEYFVRIKDKKINLIGNLHPLSVYEKTKIFIFQDVVTMQKNLLRINNAENCNFSSLIGESERYTAVKKRAQMLTHTGEHILISGEAGTGKKLFARSIHNESPRREKPFVVASCGNTVDLVMDRELFGVNSQASNGAPGDPLGLLALAEGGTLYLDEISELDYFLQRKLLQTMESGRYDVRVIASSSYDLGSKIKGNGFSPELYYALSAYPINIPPLRMRRSDILLLCTHYLRKINRLEGKDVSLDTDVLNLLINYDWPGNVRELEGMIGLIVYTVINDRPVKVENLPDSMRTKLLDNKEDKFNLNKLEKQMMIEALNTFANVPNAKDCIAKALGISRATLYRKLDKYDISEKVLYMLDAE